jgi:WD40 repeat protein
MSRCAPRPGFNLDLTFRYHVGKVRNVVPMGHRDCFISYDATTLKVWQQSTIDPHKFDILCDMSMPHNQYNFVSTLCFNPNSNHIMVACADNSLKVFTDKLRLRCSLPWVNSSIATMVYNPVTDGIITSGAAGVKLWHSNPDQTGYKRAKAANEPMERPLIVAGRPVPWCYGSFERITNKLTYQ